MNLKTIGKNICAALYAIGIVLSATSAHALELAQSPLFLTQPVKPIVMLTMTVDHELFKKAYNDYSNLGGGLLTMEDTTYRNDFTYYGYFDSDWCYTYVNNGSASGQYFVPHAQAVNHVCSATGASTAAGAWSGNFLNWATMTRIDILRQVLYGGKRSVDTEERTVLERTYLPKDVHAFVKVYGGSDVGSYTPYTSAVSLCNVSSGNSGHPTIRVASGEWRQWSASEGDQCRWRGEDEKASYTMDPPAADELATLTAKVEVCKPGADAATSSRCQAYGTEDISYKPTGVLQRHGEEGRLKFGLVTGSYKANLKGGVLRKPASLFANNINADHDEVNLATGQFNDVDGIVKNIDAFRIAGYLFSSNNYTDCSTHSIPISTLKSSGRASNRSCSDWGNPLAEIYLETLRYLSGAEEATAAFDVDDSTAGTNNHFSGISDLSRVTDWDDPIALNEWCTNCSIIVLSTGANSFDGDDLGTASDLSGLTGAASVNSYTDEVGQLEYGSFDGAFFAGGTDTERHCTATELGGLSDAVGICPEVPALEGTYAVAGLAYYARTQDLRPDRNETQTVRTYAVDLAESLPSFTVPVGGGEVTFLPACEARPGDGSWQGCSLFDVMVEDLVFEGGRPGSGSYVFFWEDSLWGNDYDIDGAQRIEFCVGAACNDDGVGNNQIRLTNSVPYAFAGNHLRFSYTITGTDGADGIVTPWANRPGNRNYDALGGTASIPSDVDTRVNIFSPGSTAATLLKSPLYYAAKYGGFTDMDGDGTPLHESGDTREWDTRNNLTGEQEPDGVPDAYFSVSNPAQLQNSLEVIVSSIIASVGSASSVATNSTRLETGTVVFQALFNSEFWTGEIKALPIESDGSVGTDPVWQTGMDKFASPEARNIVTTNDETGLGVRFLWDNLSGAQRAILGSQDTLQWLRGHNVGGLRSRDTLLGDIVNSDPVHAGSQNHRFHDLPPSLGGRVDNTDPYGEYLRDVKGDRPGVLYIGANDGMMHAFNAQTGHEMFAYVPSMVYDRLSDLSLSNYGSADNPHLYNVDGPIFVGDAYFTHSGVTEWRNILVGTLGAGGRGLFVLDVTDPSNFNENNVLFELTEDDLPEIGNITGQPIVAPTSDGWKILVGNGYNSDSGRSSLIVVDLDDPKGNSTVVLNTDTVGSNGLAEPALLPNGQGIITHVYAGDLQGRMWKFDLSSDSPAAWGASFGGQPFFTARDAAGQVQPITAAPTLGRNAQKDNATMVYFGTGSYLTTADNEPGNTVQSFYALADTGTRITSIDRSDLMEKSIAYQAVSDDPDLDGRAVRQISNNDNTDWWAGANEKRGWYLDFQYGVAITGERVISKPLLAYDRLLFPTLITSSEVCDFGGSGWLMELIAVGDRYVNHSILGEDGLSLDYAVLGLSGLILDGENIYIPWSDIRGETGLEEGARPSGSYGRMSWRQLR